MKTQHFARLTILLTTKNATFLILMTVRFFQIIDVHSRASISERKRRRRKIRGYARVC